MLRVRDLINELQKFPENYPVVVQASMDHDGDSSGRYILDIKERNAGFAAFHVASLIPGDRVVVLT